MRAIRTLAFLSISLSLAACGPQSHPSDPGVDAGPPVELPPTGATASLTIGSSGATLTLGTFTLEVPPGAIPEETEVRVRVSDPTPPSHFQAYSPVFHFEPEGLVFARPITVRMPFNGDSRTATVFWTTRINGAYAPVPTRIEGRYAIAESTHFSSAFVGTACSGDDCCGQANGDLDVLFVVDNSNSMEEEQASLAAQIPRLARVLATGDLDDDGVQDFPALRSIRIGTVSTDMGTGGFLIPTCNEPNYGDDGILRTESASPECAAGYPKFAELDLDDPNADVDAFVEHVSCVSLLGLGGCGFEQPLEAALKALTPSTSPIRFLNETSGHGDGANADFSRPDALLATIVLTDEEDCSVVDPEIFSENHPSYAATPLNLRCFFHSDAVHPISRYTSGLKALRANPDDVIFAAIAGVPTDLVSDPNALDYEAILSDPRMLETVDPNMPNRLVPSCSTDRGLAFPPRRIVQVAESFGSNGIVQSICQEDFTPVIDAILQRVAARASGACTSP